MAESSIERQFFYRWQKLYPAVSLDREVLLIPKRRFRFDFVHQPSRVAIEIQGGTYARSPKSHSTGVGLDRDYEKNNLAQYHGYVIFQLSCKMITDEWLRLIYETINARL
jgi:hypothetical protein